jgi:hypothetical protein
VAVSQADDEVAVVIEHRPARVLHELDDRRLRVLGPVGESGAPADLREARLRIAADAIRDSAGR